MGQVSIPVDLLNPGQVFACLGLLEAADVLCGPAEGGFDWTGKPQYTLRAEAENPLVEVFHFLATAKIAAIAPVSKLSDEYGLPTVHESEPVFPSPELKASILPVTLSDESGRAIRLSHWSESNDSTAGLDNTKFWGGAGGYSGAARTRDLQQAFVASLTENMNEALNAPFDVSALLSNGFRLEMRRDYVPIDVGFSPNKHHGSMEIVGFPLVELLAAIGLEYARPIRVSRLAYQYAVWGKALPPLLARPALGGHLSGFPARHFSMKLGQPNKFDRSILFAIEETRHD